MRRIMSNQVDVGMLQIAVFQEGKTKPIGDCLVNLYGTDDSGNIVQLDSLKTDSSGRCPEIELAAPPVEYSMEADSPRPYSLYSLSVEAQGMEAVNIENLQLLPNSTAIQNVELIPPKPAATQEKPKNATAAEVIDIEPHTLYYEFPEKTPEDPVKPLPPPTGFVVLDRVVVPETIVVHNGSPDSNAQNFYVPFRDYIKAVASSEIYATWPDASLRANILAILSFTLNRVYTEWYRNKGKNFTITNSTA